MNVSTVWFMTIVVSSVERVVIVFPATLDSALVTVGDVDVRCPVQEWVFESHDDSG